MGEKQQPGLLGAGLQADSPNKPVTSYIPLRLHLTTSPRSNLEPKKPERLNTSNLNHAA